MNTTSASAPARSAPKISRPAPDECQSYFHGYIAKVPASGAGQALVDQIADVAATFGPLDALAAATIHPPYQWTIGEVMGHLIDGERVFGYRGARIAAGDQTTLPSFDEHLMVTGSDYRNTDCQALLREWIAVREANLLMFGRLTDEQLNRRGNANGNPITARALAWIMAGHVAHHLPIVRQRLGLK
jgi:DinB superfamily